MKYKQENGNSEDIVVGVSLGAYGKYEDGVTQAYFRKNEGVRINLHVRKGVSWWKWDRGSHFIRSAINVTEKTYK